MPPGDMHDLAAAVEAALARCGGRSVEVSDLLELVALAKAVRGGEAWKGQPLADALDRTLRACASGGVKVGDGVRIADVHRIESPRTAAALAAATFCLAAGASGAEQEESAIGVTCAACAVAIERAPALGADVSPDHAGAMREIGMAIAYARYGGKPPTTPITHAGIAVRTFLGKLWGAPSRASVESIWQVHELKNVDAPVAIVRRLESSTFMPLVPCEGYGLDPRTVPLVLPPGAWRDPAMSSTDGRKVDVWRTGPRPATSAGATP